MAEDVNFEQRRTNPAGGQGEIQLHSGPLDSKFSVLTTLYQVVLNDIGNFCGIVALVTSGSFGYTVTQLVGNTVFRFFQGQKRSSRGIF